MASENYTTLNFKLGDPSDDGHGKVFAGYIKINHSNEELKAAMQKFVDATGIDWECWCNEYEERTIPHEDAVKLAEYLKCDFAELPCDGMDEDFDGEQVPWHCPESFIEMLMDICAVELPDLQWSWYSPDSEQAFFDGCGYGLFD